MKDCWERGQAWCWRRVIVIQWAIAMMINRYCRIATIRYDRCREVVLRIRTLGIPPDAEDERTVALEHKLTAMVYFIAVAINHQTTPHKGPKLRGVIEGRERFGWDYLLGKFFERARGEPDFFLPGRLRAFRGEDLIELLADGQGGGVIKDPARRAWLIRDIARRMEVSGLESIWDTYAYSGGWLMRPDGRGLLQTIPSMIAYADPIKKKIFYFLAIMRNEKFWVYRDEEHLGSPVNYNEERGQLRLGTVTIRCSWLEKRILAREDLGMFGWLFDFALRATIHEVVLWMARELAVTPSTLHYYFWYYFRHCCSRDNPHCRACGPSCSLPGRYQIGQGGRCIFSPVCPSAGMSAADMYTELRTDRTIFQ